MEVIHINTNVELISQLYTNYHKKKKLRIPLPHHKDKILILIRFFCCMTRNCLSSNLLYTNYKQEVNPISVGLHPIQP